MADNHYVIDATAENFAEAVVANSHRVPVMVDFWAAWCGPCKMLLPVVTRLAEEYAGQFILAKVNIDEQQALATQYGVRSVPTVLILRHGEIVDQFMGAQPESAIRPLIDAWIERESDRALATAKGLAQTGKGEEALALLTSWLEREPENSRLLVGQAELLVAQDRFAEAEALMRALPADVGARPEVATLLAQLEFGRSAHGAPSLPELERAVAEDPKNSAARYQLAARHVVAGQFEEALRQLLELVRRDRTFGNDAGRTGMLKVFELLGGKGELVSRYRSQMFNALH